MNEFLYSGVLSTSVSGIVTIAAALTVFLFIIKLPILTVTASAVTVIAALLTDIKYTDLCALISVMLLLCAVSHIIRVGLQKLPKNASDGTAEKKQQS